MVKRFQVLVCWSWFFTIIWHLIEQTIILVIGEIIVTWIKILSCLILIIFGLVSKLSDSNFLFSIKSNPGEGHLFQWSQCEQELLVNKTFYVNIKSIFWHSASFIPTNLSSGFIRFVAQCRINFTDVIFTSWYQKNLWYFVNSFMIFYLVLFFTCLRVLMYYSMFSPYLDNNSFLNIYISYLILKGGKNVIIVLLLSE